MVEAYFQNEERGYAAWNGNGNRDSNNEIQRPKLPTLFHCLFWGSYAFPPDVHPLQSLKVHRLKLLV
ncbi:bidirectional sugar transporter SWEET6b-like [Sesbania bispinosa]|nr:bidirectional sugar transporter SWEET6b-like [Sesbania bispinosa]